jgi:hypothetical protein
MNKNCSICNEEKEISSFYYIKATGNFTAECKSCKSLRGKRYYEQNISSRLEYANLYYQENREEKLVYKKKYKENNTELSKEIDKRYRNNNIEKIKIDQIKYREEHKDILSIYQKQYRKENKISLKEKQREYEANKSKTDIIYKLRKNISRAINFRLKLNNSSKAGESIIKFLPFTIDALKDHLEAKFEPWMNWKNQGIYKLEEWDDNDPTTWKWQIDHIIPQSDFPYKTMNDDNFKKCWALDNLRPYNAKYNLIKRNKRIENGNR